MRNKQDCIDAAVAGALVLTPALAAAAPFVFNSRLKVRRYAVATPKVTRGVRLVLLSDLHGCRYGAMQRDLLRAVARQRPDAVLLGGDIADDRHPNLNTWETVRPLAQRYPCYYVSGNHEVRGGELPRIKHLMRKWGVTVLEGDCAVLPVKGQRVQICGVDDPDLGSLRFLRQLDAASARLRGADVSVLLTHRPEYAAWYAKYPFDLVLAGHAHGGQWRLPGLIEGVYASRQGLFPRYAGGRFRFAGGQTLVIGRGLARETSYPVPRIFDRPEVVIVDLVPIKSNAADTPKETV